VVLQAFIDESEGEDGTFVLGGHIAGAEAWAKFSAEWDRMLPHATLNRNGIYQFKMSDMAQTPDRMSRVSWFYRIIEKHVTGSMHVTINSHALRRAIRRVHARGWNLNFAQMANPYTLSYRILIDSFHDRRGEIGRIVGKGEKVDFYFDERMEKGYIRETWERYIESRTPEARARYGNKPRFEKDEEFLPLQAADLWVWWVRKWRAEGKVGIFDALEFEGWAAKKPRPILEISLTEELLVGELMKIAQHHLGPGIAVFDAGPT
jgi:hypothetical protein